MNLAVIKRKMKFISVQKKRMAWSRLYLTSDSLLISYLNIIILERGFWWTWQWWTGWSVWIFPGHRWRSSWWSWGWNWWVRNKNQGIIPRVSYVFLSHLYISREQNMEAGISAMISLAKEGSCILLPVSLFQVPQLTNLMLLR